MRAPTLRVWAREERAQEVTAKAKHNSTSKTKRGRAASASRPGRWAWQAGLEGRFLSSKITLLRPAPAPPLPERYAPAESISGFI